MLLPMVAKLAMPKQRRCLQEPGFVSAKLHRSIDGEKVTMYAQWRSIEDYQAMRENPAPLTYFELAVAFATFEPGMYEVVETYAPPPDEA